MTDFHTHILPGMDDGSRNTKMSLAMLRMEKEQGITHVALTPHYYAIEESPQQFLRRRQAAWERLEPHLTNDLPRLRLGAEVQYFEGICRVEGLEQLRLQGTKLLLLEMPMCRWSARVLDDVAVLNSREGIQVVIAHIERYLAQQPRGILDTLAAMGVWIQSNIAYFADWRTRYTALRLLREGKIHIISSDCHSLGHRRPNWDQLPEKAKELIRKQSVIFTR